MARRIYTQADGIAFNHTNGTVNVAGLMPFDFGKVTAIVNQTKGLPLYAALDPTLRATYASGIIALTIDTSAMADADLVQLFYEGDLQSVSVAQALPPGTNNIGVVSVSNLPATQAVSLATVPTHAVTQGGAPWSVSWSGQSVSISGTASVSAAQSGTWTVGLASGASVSVSNFPTTQAVSGTFWQATQPVSAASLPLPTGAATDAKVEAVRALLAAPLTVSDNQSASYASAVAMTAGSAYSAARAVGIYATASGDITLTLAGGGTITLPINPGWQIYPFAATQFAFANSGAGTVYNLP